jgi:hypothetical protein
VPTGLTALGDDHVDAGFGGRHRLGNRADGVEVKRSGIVDEVDVGVGITPERGDERDSRETAAASSGHVALPIGACTIGTSIPNSSHSGVDSDSVMLPVTFGRCR